MKKIDKWRYGTVAVRVPEAAEDRSPEAFLFIARKRGRSWDATVEGTPGFQRHLDRSPQSLVPANVRALFPAAAEFIAEGDGSAQLSLPWETGVTWIMGGGPHSNSGNGTRPRSALDFNARRNEPQDVRAAAAGVAFVPCKNFVRVNHADGWQTGYYHLTEIAVSNNQPVARGQVLGTAAGATECGGFSTGPHVHFTLLRHGAHQEIDGRDIGGWTVDEGAADYEGCLAKGTVTACAANGQILNDGSVGSGTAPTPTPSPSPTPSPTTTPTPVPPTPVPPPSAPALTAPDDGNVFAEGSAIALDWTAVGADVEYITEITGGPEGTGSVGPQGASATEIGPLPAGYAYTWRVKARGPGGDSPWSEPRDFSVRLATPAELQAKILSCTEVRLSWQDRSAGEDGYRLLREETPIGDVNADESAVVLRNLPEGATHAFTVRAFRADQQSASSNSAQATTPPCDVTPPTGSWIDPADGHTLRQADVRLEASASDAGSGVERVELRARWDGTWHDLATLSAPPFHLDWNLCAAGVPDGPIDLRLRVVDYAGNDAVATIGAVKRVNCDPNLPPAEPRIESPTGNEPVVGEIRIAVVASDSYDMPDELRVHVRIDDGPWTDAVYADQSGHFIASWDSPISADGPHTIRARATDSGGLDATSERVEVVVDNVDELPVAAAGPDLTLTDTDGNGTEPVTLDAGASTYDPQRTASYAWEAHRDGFAASSLGSGQNLPIELALGVNRVTLTVTDSLGNQDADELIVTVDPPPDTFPPHRSAALSLAPGAGARGESVAVTASGYRPGEKVTLTWDEGQPTKAENKKGKGKKGKKGEKGKKRRNANARPRVTTLGTAITSADGDAALTFRVPEQAAIGDHRIEGIGSDGKRAAVTFEVMPGAVRAATESASTMPENGAADDLGSQGAENDPQPIDPDDAQALTATGPAFAAGPPKRKPGKSRDRAQRDDDNDTNTRVKKHARGPKRQGRDSKEAKRPDGR